MTKYELVRKTELNGDVWYFIRKADGYSVESSWTTKLEDAEEMLKKIEMSGTQAPTFETLKTIEVKEGAND
jgi:hypothetical protein